MSEDGEIVDVPEAVEQDAGGAAAAAGGKKERKERPPPEKCAAPDHVAFEAKIKKNELEIEDLNRKIADMAPQIKKYSDERAKSKEEFQTKLKSLKALRETQKTAAKQAEEAKAKQAKMEADIDHKKKRSETVRKSLRYKDPSEFDKDIAKIEYQMAHTSMSLREIKDAMAEIKALNLQKSELVAYNAEMKLSDPKDDFAALNVLRDQRKELGKAFGVAKEQAQALSDEVTAAKQADEKANAMIVALLDTKKLHNDRKTALIDESKKVRADFKQQEYMYNNWVEYQDFQKRQALRERRKKEDAEWEAKRAAEAAEQEVEEATRDHWEEEKELCKQLLRYLNRCLPQDSEASAPTEEEGGVVEDRRDMDDEEREFFACKGGKNAKATDDSIMGGDGSYGKKKGKAAKMADKPKAAPKPKKLIHTPDVFVQFDLIDLTPPLDYSGIEAAIAAVQEKSDYFNSNPDKSEKEELKARRVQKAKAVAAALRKAAKLPVEKDEGGGPAAASPVAVASGPSAAQVASGKA